MSEAPKTDQNQGMDISAILNNPQVPKVYINRTLVGNTVSDMFVIAQSTGTAPTVVQMSFITAKTLADDILRMIADFESKTGQKILSMKEIQHKMAKQFGETTM
jgi:hypothetical protein